VTDMVITVVTTMTVFVTIYGQGDRRMPLGG
jgi:hypothetical protein